MWKIDKNDKLMEGDINWKKVYSTQDFYRAELVKLILDEKNLPAFVLNKRDTAYNNFGDIEVYVDQRNVIAALKIIEDEIHFE